jgi:hypothetical protein
MMYEEEDERKKRERGGEAGISRGKQGSVRQKWLKSKCHTSKLWDKVEHPLSEQKTTK